MPRAIAKSPGTKCCRKCSYLLYGLNSNTCPECGRPFDLDDSRTYLETSVRPLGHWVFYSLGAMALAIPACVMGNHPSKEVAEYMFFALPPVPLIISLISFFSMSIRQQVLAFAPGAFLAALFWCFAALSLSQHRAGCREPIAYDYMWGSCIACAVIMLMSGALLYPFTRARIIRCRHSFWLCGFSILFALGLWYYTAGFAFGWAWSCL